MASLEASSHENIYILVFKRCSRSRFDLAIEHRLVLRAEPYVKSQVKGVYQELSRHSSRGPHDFGSECLVLSVKIKNSVTSKVVSD